MNEQPLRVLVLGGGPDAERDVSLRSAAAVAAALRRAGHTVLESDIGPEDASPLRADVQVIFPVLHGPFGEGGPLQRMLEANGVPYVGSGPEAAAAAMDKAVSKSIAESCGVPTPAAQVIGGAADLSLEPPLVLKPLDSGSSCGVFICRDRSALETALRPLLAEHGRVLAERFIEGAELTVGLVDDQTLPPIQIVPASAFYDFEAKYDRNDTQYRFDFEIPPETSRAMLEHALAVHRAIGARDLSRVDFLVDAEHRPWFLEINTMPGFTDHSLLPMAAARAGLPMERLCDRLARLALNR
ncbi:MAG: D-alanine--D-alanine ligase [Phycisphaeraceae bacterium]|nr:D-alanine--D-alanine ligase [Phycisphaeraceae bacterium]